MCRNDIRVRVRVERSGVEVPMLILPNRSRHGPVSLRWMYRLLAVSAVLLGCVAGTAAGWQTVGSAVRQSQGVAGKRVDLDLVLAVDASDSMSPAELLIQRQGYGAAFRHADVVAAVETRGVVAVT